MLVLKLACADGQKESGKVAVQFFDKRLKCTFSGIHASHLHEVSDSTENVLRSIELMHPGDF